jgi:queuine/archaeosine tRNA-ribosyltransferase
LYFESKEESKMNQNMNIEIRISGDVDNCYRFDKRGKKINEKINMSLRWSRDRSQSA